MRLNEAYTALGYTMNRGVIYSALGNTQESLCLTIWVKELKNKSFLDTSKDSDVSQCSHNRNIARRNQLRIAMRDKLPIHIIMLPGEVGKPIGNSAYTLPKHDVWECCSVGDDGNFFVRRKGTA